MLPPQLTLVGGRLSKFVEGWKHITNDPYVLSIVAKGYRLRFTSPPFLRQTPWEIRSPQGLEEILGMREQITLMLQKNAITEVPPNSPGFYSNVFLVRKASGGWRPVIDLKNLNAHIHAPHFRMSTTSSTELRSKRRLRVQNRSTGCILSRTYPSQQQKVPQVRLREQGVPVSGATLRSEHSPSDFYSIGAHGDRLSSPSGDLGDTISRRLFDSPSRPPSSTPTSGRANKYTGPSRLYPKQKEIQAGPDSGSPVSWNPFTPGLRGSFPSRVQRMGDSCSRTHSIFHPSTNLFSSVPAYGITQLGLRSYPSWSFVPETSSTSFSLIRSHRPVYATASIRSTGPWLPTFYGTGPTFSYLRNPYPHISGGIHDFYRRLHSGVGCSHGGFPDFGYLDPYRPQAPYQLSGAQSGNLCHKALGPSAPGPPGYDRYGQFDSSFVYQQARRDPFSQLVTFDSRASPLVRGSEQKFEQDIFQAV